MQAGENGKEISMNIQTIFKHRPQTQKNQDRWKKHKENAKNIPGKKTRL